MNRKGFTLIELLAVIAILAILLIFALPRVIKLYNEFRENAFRIEAMNIYDVGIKERTKSVIENKKLVNEYASNGEKLSIKINKKIEYGIKFGSQPKEMKYFCVSNGEYRIRIDYESEANIITKDSIEKITIENTNELCVSQSSTNVAIKFFEAGSRKSVIVDSNNNLWIRGNNNRTVSTLNFIPFDSSQKFQSVSIGDNHSLGIDTSGKLWAWGDSASGVLGIEGKTSRATPVQITASNGSVTEFQGISAGSSKSLAIDEEGNLWSWGENNCVQLRADGGGVVTYDSLPVQITVSNGSVTKFQSAIAGYCKNFVIDIEGNLWGWGYNGEGQLGDGTTTGRTTPVQITASNGSVTKFQSVSVGYYHSLAIDIEGNLWAWGSGMLGDGTTTTRTTPVQITASNGSVTKFQSVSAGNAYSMAIDIEGNLWAWGYNYDGYLGDGTATDRLSPVQITASNGNVTKFQSVSAGNDNTLAIDINENLWAWGKNQYGQLGDGTATDRLSPVQITASNGSVTKFQSISVGDYYSIAIDINNNAYYTGLPFIANNKIKSNFSISKLELCNNRIYALSEENNLWAWGENYQGQLGDGMSITGYTPVQIMLSNKSITKFQNISAKAYDYSIAIDINRNLWAWGNNNHGKLGDGTTTTRTTPVQITASNGSVTKFQNISSNFDHSIAIDIEGNLWGWGYNVYGQLGDGTTTDKTAPVQITASNGSVTKFQSVSVGSYHSLAIDINGNLWAWGSNSYGALGDGTGVMQTSPVQITASNGSVTKFQSVSVGNFYSLAIDIEGNLWAWGNNESGQLGNGTSINSSRPVQIIASNGTVTKFKGISAGSAHSLAMDINGNLWAWGSNSYAQIDENLDWKITSPLMIELE